MCWKQLRTQSKMKLLARGPTRKFDMPAIEDLKMSLQVVVYYLFICVVRPLPDQLSMLLSTGGLWLIAHIYSELHCGFCFINEAYQNKLSFHKPQVSPTEAKPYYISPSYLHNRSLTHVFFFFFSFYTHPSVLWYFVVQTETRQVVAERSC